jgi:hypothetical protein
MFMLKFLPGQGLQWKYLQRMRSMLRKTGAESPVPPADGSPPDLYLQVDSSIKIY